MIEYRHDRSRWDELKFSPARDEKWGDYDQNEKARLRVVLALKYDRTAVDEELLRFVLEQEVVAREHDSFQGIGTTLELGAFLLARFRAPEDAALFAKAKLANFDTACGFDSEYVFWPLRDDTESFLRKHHPELANTLAEHLGSLELPDGLDEWWERRCQLTPASEGEETLLARYERHLQLENHDKARRCLQMWAEREPESETKWSRLKYEYAELEDWAQAVLFARKLVNATETDWDEASALSSLADLLHRAGDQDETLACLRELDIAFSRFDDWTDCGLGRMAIRRAYEVAADQTSLERALEAFHLADRWLSRATNLALIDLDAAVKAARRCELAQRAGELEKLAAAKRCSMDKMMGR